MNTAIEQLNHAAALVVPEIVLLATVCVMFLVGPFLVGDAQQATAGLRHRWGGLALAALGTAGLVWFNSEPLVIEGGPFSADALVWYTRGLSLSLGAVLVLLLWNQVDDAHAAEAQACLLAIIAGTNLVAAANDLVVLFLALELVSIPTYIILFLLRAEKGVRNLLPKRPEGCSAQKVSDPFFPTGEATIKYFLLSVFSSALVLYGMSWLYGATGTTNLSGIGQVFAATDGDKSALLYLAFGLLLAGLCFRIAAFPFHFYAPDVFQGVTSSNAALLSFIPKVVGFVALVRLLPLVGVTVSPSLWLTDAGPRILLGALAVVTMFVGNLMALRQKHLHRLLAYSSVAHAGYMLIGLAVGNVGVVGGTTALLFYLAAYGLMTVGVFALLRGAGGADRTLETDDDLRGLSRLNPTTALLLTVCLLSLTGLPPTVGFLGKLYLFFAAWAESTWVGQSLAACLAVNAAIAAWYYLRLVALMYLEEPETREARPVELGSWLGGLACAVATLILFPTAQWLWDIVARIGA